MKALTASRIDLGRRCPGFAAIQHEDTPNDFTESGSEKHEAQDAAIRAGAIPETYAERWPGLVWRSEVKFSINLVTGEGRELGSGSDRDYSAVSEDEIAGTADVVGMSADLLVIVDKKSFDPGVPRAAVNAQVHVAALAFARTHGYTSAEVAIDHEVRGLDVAMLDDFDLISFREELVTIAANVRAQLGSTTPSLNEGSWCRWCPALLHCPAKVALRRQAEQSIALVDSGRSPVPFLESDDDAADAYDFAEKLRILLKRLDAALYARAKDKPIPLRSGKMFGTVQKLGNEKLDGDKVYAVVKEKYGQGIADAAVIRTATKTRLKEALEFAGVSSKAAAERAILDEVRKRGGAPRETKTVIDEYDAEPLLASGGVS